MLHKQFGLRVKKSRRFERNTPYAEGKQDIKLRRAFNVTNDSSELTSCIL